MHERKDLTLRKQIPKDLSYVCPKWAIKTNETVLTFNCVWVPPLQVFKFTEFLSYSHYSLDPLHAPLRMNITTLHKKNKKSLITVVAKVVSPCPWALTLDTGKHKIENLCSSMVSQWSWTLSCRRFAGFSDTDDKGRGPWQFTNFQSSYLFPFKWEIFSCSKIYTTKSL